VTGFAGEINREAGEDGIHGLDPAKTPTAMRTKAAIGQLNQGFHLPPLNFSGCRQLLEFFSHIYWFFLASLQSACQH
jgi:hypothetical protein